MTCKICNSPTEPTESYSGAIRDGKWGTFLDPVQIHRCGNCGVQRLPERLFKTAEYYTSGEYDRQVREPITDYSPYQRHLDVVERKCTHRDSLLDVGGGLGAFSEIANDIFEVVAGYDVGEECPIMHPSVVTSFNVIEHVEDPLLFMRQIFDILPPGGEVVICTRTVIISSWN